MIQQRLFPAPAEDLISATEALAFGAYVRVGRFGRPGQRDLLEIDRVEGGFEVVLRTVRGEWYRKAFKSARGAAKFATSERRSLEVN